MGGTLRVELLLIFVLASLDVGSEDVIRVLSRGDDHLTVLRVEAQFFNVVLALMEEEKLRGQLFIISSTLVNFDGEVPNGKLVISAGDGKDGVFTWLKLEASDSLCVPADASD